jgi:hypothetical protein
MPFVTVSRAPSACDAAFRPLAAAVSCFRQGKLAGGPVATSWVRSRAQVRVGGDAGVKLFQQARVADPRLGERLQLATATHRRTSALPHASQNRASASFPCWQPEPGIQVFGFGKRSGV